MGNSSVTEDGNSDVPGQVRSIDTHVGPLEVRVFGDIDAVATGAATPVICFHGAKFSLLPEWIPIANALAETSKFVVVIPNFHSNSVTKPTIVFGGMQPPDLCKIVKEVRTFYSPFLQFTLASVTIAYI